MRYGRARVPYNLKSGRNRRVKTMKEWVGPRCSIRLGISRSISGITEKRNRRGMFTFVLVSFDMVFPERYPRARCPTANVCCPSYCVCLVISLRA